MARTIALDPKYSEWAKRVLIKSLMPPTEEELKQMRETTKWRIEEMARVEPK